MDRYPSWSYLRLTSAGSDKQQTLPTDLLNEFRKLIRKELGYGSDLELNREKAWFGKVGFEPKEEKTA
jgi:hypothetical protein